VVIVLAPQEVRLERLAARGMPEDDARARMAKQADDDERRAVADEIVVNDGTREHLQAQVDAVWERLAG
jgi:dephospho-CoA kinase